MSEDRSWACPVLHVDMDAFFASVMLRDRPELRERPVVIGGGRRGVVLAANYPARSYGVRSAMSGAQARRLCPDLVALPPDHASITVVSRAVMETLRRVTPVIEIVSLDEAFLDVAGAERRLGSPLRIAEQIRARIHDEQRITCSVGAAATIAVAKLASIRAKPDGIMVVPPETVTAFLHPLDIRALWGVGAATETALHRLGLRTVGDLAQAPGPALRQALGAHRAAHVRALARGEGRREVRARESPAFGPVAASEPGSGPGAASMGAQSTFSRDIVERSPVLRELLRLTASVTGRLRAAGLMGPTVVLTVRFADFTTITRSRTRPEATDVTVEVYNIACQLFGALDLGRARLRLVGVRVEGLRPRRSVQHQHLLGERDRGWSEAERAVDRATDRFGSAAVRPATLLG